MANSPFPSPTTVDASRNVASPVVSPKSPNPTAMITIPGTISVVRFHRSEYSPLGYWTTA